MSFAKESAVQASSARSLASDLGLTSGPAASLFGPAFEAALAAWIEAYRIVIQSRYRLDVPLPGLDDTPVDGDLRRILTTAKDAERVYAWARLWRVEDALRRGFGLSITGPRLSGYIESMKPVRRLRPREIEVLIPFFGGVWLDGGLFQELWRRFKPGYTAKDDCRGLRDETLDFFLRLIEREWFPGSFQPTRRILDCVRAGDNKSFNHLVNLQPERLHGSGVFAGHVIRVLGFDFGEPRPGKKASDTLAWFADSSGKAPGPKWHERRAELQAVLPDGTLHALSKWVHEHPDLRYFGGKPYRDDLYWRVWKSAAWHLGRNP